MPAGVVVMRDPMTWSPLPWKRLRHPSGPYIAAGGGTRSYPKSRAQGGRALDVWGLFRMV